MKLVTDRKSEVKSGAGDARPNAERKSGRSNQMTEKERMLDSLFSGKEGREIVDVKFFLGDKRNISVEEICREVNGARQQAKLGVIEPMTSFDAGIKQISVEEFIAA